jgi:membrane protein implicated in regulation of membrane protease activity
MNVYFNKLKEMNLPLWLNVLGVIGIIFLFLIALFANGWIIIKVLWLFRITDLSHLGIWKTIIFGFVISLSWDVVYYPYLKQFKQEQKELQEEFNNIDENKEDKDNNTKE